MKTCKYCGREANYQFKNGTLCCSEFSSQCQAIKRKNSEKNKGHVVSIETREKISIATSGVKKKELTKKQKEKRSRAAYKRYKENPEIKEKISRKMKELFSIEKNNKYKKLTEEKIKDKYKMFSTVEKMKTVSGELQVRCRLNTCREWFCPTYIQLYERIRAIEQWDKDLNSFYCSEGCKNKCPIYGKSAAQILNERKSRLYNQQEYQTFREFVLNRDQYICQFCGDEAIDVHHERPQKLEPFFALDPDFAWSCCKKCHYEKGHSEECSTGKLASIKCN